jgi:hypothetical protein
MHVSEEIKRLDWAIAARERSQKLLLALYEFGQHESERPKTEVFSLLVGVAFSLWRAAFLADAPTRTWPEALADAQEFLKTVLRTNAIAFNTEHTRQGWTGGYYLNNAKLRLEEVLRRQMESGQTHAAEDLTRIRNISLLGTDPHDTWTRFCEAAEQLAQQIGCRLISKSR